MQDVELWYHTRYAQANVTEPAKAGPVKGKTMLDDAKIHVKIKLSALWSAVMFCYVYGDIFGFFQPGKLQELLEGKTPIGPTTQGKLLGFSTIMAIPSLMVFLPLVLKPTVNRWANIIVGAIYTVIILLTMRGAWNFYIFLGIIEVALTALIVWYAWTWPSSP